METINNTFTNASNSLWSEVHPTQTPDNPYASQHGDEPLSGIQGKGTATDPYDAGNRDGKLPVSFFLTLPPIHIPSMNQTALPNRMAETNNHQEQPGAPTTKENTAVIPEALASIHVDHARNPKSPSNADFGPKNVFIDEPPRERKTNYPAGNTTTSGTKLVPSHIGVPEQRTQRSTYGQGSPYPQTQKGGDTAGSSSGTSGAYAYPGQGVPYTPKGGDLAETSSATSVYSDQESAYPPKSRDLAGSPSATSGAYAYSGQVGQDTLPIRDSTSKDQGLKEQSSRSGGAAVQSMPDNAAASSLQKEETASPMMAAGTLDKQDAKNKMDSAATGSLQREKDPLGPSTAEEATNKQGAMGKIDSARNLQQDKESASKSIPDGANGVATENKTTDKEAQLQQKAKSSTDNPSMDKSTSGGIVDSTPTTGNKEEETTNGSIGSASREEKGKDTATTGDSETKAPRNNKVSEEALRGPQTPAPREPYEFEKRLDQRRTSRSKQGQPAAPFT